LPNGSEMTYRLPNPHPDALPIPESPNGAIPRLKIPSGHR